jgi:hypothetical protein
MAAEKVCKAHLHADGNIVKESHSVVRKHLPSVAREFGPMRGLSGSRLKMLKHLAAEIDFLAPALSAAGARRDNVEYPWEDSNQEIVAPVDHAFNRIDNRQIADVVKLLKVAASYYASSASFSGAKLKY